MADLCPTPRTTRCDNRFSTRKKMVSRLQSVFRILHPCHQNILIIRKVKTMSQLYDTKWYFCTQQGAQVTTAALFSRRRRWIAWTEGTVDHKDEKLAIRTHTNTHAKHTRTHRHSRSVSTPPAPNRRSKIESRKWLSLGAAPW